MPRILAIEADPRRQHMLTTLVREHVKADLVVVASVRAAIGSIAERTPDLIIAPTLLSPPDEAELLTHMKGLDTAPYIQMLTAPALDMLADVPVQGTRRRDVLDAVFNHRPVSVVPQYDRSLLTAQIVDGLARSRELRFEYAARLAFDEAMGGRSAQHPSRFLTRSSGHEVREAPSARAEQKVRDRAREERRVASRKGRGDVPWLSGIKVSWGPELELINISSTGVLVESGSKFAPGSTTNLQLCGPETNLMVLARFLRSDVARIDGLGVRYRAAAAFAEELDIDRRDRPGSEGRTPATPPEELAALFGAVLSSARDEPAHQRFAQGVRQLVGARDVRVRTGSTGSPAGRDTLYFDVPDDDRSRKTLQVMFDRDHDVTDAEFKMLKAAAWLTAAVLELEKPVRLPAGHTGPMAVVGGGMA